MIGNAAITSEEQSKERDWKNIHSDDYRDIHKVSTGKYLASKYALNELSKVYPINELRIRYFNKYLPVIILNKISEIFKDWTTFFI